MRKRFVVFALLGVCAVGFIPWQVTSPAQWACRWIEQRSGWKVSVTNARWIPWRDLQLMDLKLQAPRGGHVHLTQVRVSLDPRSLVMGSCATKWRFSEIRIDPTSWNIRQPLAKELLSAGPVTKNGQALLRLRGQKLSLSQLSLEGPMLQLNAEGWLTESRQVYFSMKGVLARALLEEMNLLKPNDPALRSWEPFVMNLQGALDHPEVSFASSFFTLSLKTHGERTL